MSEPAAGLGINNIYSTVSQSESSFIFSTYVKLTIKGHRQTLLTAEGIESWFEGWPSTTGFLIASMKKNNASSTAEYCQYHANGFIIMEAR